MRRLILLLLALLGLVVVFQDTLAARVGETFVVTLLLMLTSATVVLLAQQFVRQLRRRL